MPNRYSTNSPSAANMARPAGFSEQVDRNRQASAMYAAQDNARTGAAIPGHLQSYLPGGADFDASRSRSTPLGQTMGRVADAVGSVVQPIAGLAQRGMQPLAASLNERLGPGVQRIDDFMVRSGLAAPAEFRSERPEGRPGYYDPTGQTPFVPVAAGSMSFGDSMTPQQEEPQAPQAPQAATPGIGGAVEDTVDIEEIERRNRERSMVPEFREGGRVGPGGTAFRPDGTIDHPLNTQGMGVPPAIQELLGTGDMPGPGLTQVQPTPMFSYEMGGQIGPGGMPMPMAGQQPGVMEPGMQAQISPVEAQMDISRAVQQNPEQVQQVQALIMQGLQAGEITEQQLTLATQMATVVAENPEMYPQFVATMEQQGIFDPGDLSPQYDQGLIYALMLIGQSMNAGAAPQSGVQEPMMSMEQGGPLPQNSPNPDGSIPINAHEGEYVIPAEVVRAKGTDFFDKMIQSYREKGPAQ